MLHPHRQTCRDDEFAGHARLATWLDAPGRGLVPWQRQRIEHLLMAAPNARQTLSLFAQACKISVPYFSVLFKRSFGQPPYRWLLERRIGAAQTLLATSSEPLACIALACGFADQSHFTKMFSRVVGTSSGAWRRLRQAPSFIGEDDAPT